MGFVEAIGSKLFNFIKDVHRQVRIDALVDSTLAKLYPLPRHLLFILFPHGLA